MFDSSQSRTWTHDRDHIRLLHHAHADQIESLYEALRAQAGNPESVVIEQVGPVRTFLVRGKRWENRAVFHGDETHEQIDEVLRHFQNHQAHCVMEINIANSYVDPPKNWETRLLSHLLARGCQVGGMRCVWYRDKSAAAAPAAPSPTIRRFEPVQIHEYAAMALKANPREEWADERYQVEGRPGLNHYVGLEGQEPCAFGSLFIKDGIGYLAYWETRTEYRNRGFQQAGINQRVADAFGAGCDLVFTVSDYNTVSARNLQRCGFQLAYNYLVVTREPLPLP